MAFALGSLVAVPAAAQLAASVALDTDSRLRGYSLTDDHPALTAQLSLDHRSGLYVNLSGLTELGDDTRFLGVIGDAGYAKRLSEHLTLDAGVLRYQLRAAPGAGRGYKYTEIYAGAYLGPMSGRFYYSPDYRQLGVSTLYSELEAGFDPLPKWRISGHLGLLTYLNSSYLYPSAKSHRDWRLSIGRQLGQLEIHSALSGGAPRSYSTYRGRNAVALTAGASLSF